MSGVFALPFWFHAASADLQAQKFRRNGLIIPSRYQAAAALRDGLLFTATFLGADFLAVALFLAGVFRFS